MTQKIIIFVILLAFSNIKLLAENETLHLSVASSLYNLSKSLTSEWEKKTNIKTVVITGPTSLIARQIHNGQLSNLIITANRDWLAWMEDRELINIESISVIAKNSLVFSSGINQGFFIDINSINFKENFKDQLSSSMFAIPHPSSVPLGIYAKQALKSLDLWDDLNGKLVFTSSSQSNLKFIEKGEAIIGISYLSDTISSSKVLVVAKIDDSIFPYEKPTYWAAKIKRNGNDNDFGFLEWLKSSEAQKIIKNYGFETTE